MDRAKKGKKDAPKKVGRRVIRRVFKSVFVLICRMFLDDVL